MSELIRVRRASLGLLATLGGGALLAFATTVSAQPSERAGNDGATSRITIASTPLAPISTCTTADQALTYSTFSDTSTFRLRIRTSSPLCTPIVAIAAVYAMPKDGSLWPQTLAETKSFTLSAAATTEVTFAKDCTGSQFDIVTGATPRVISPLGERHGPLLFPDVNTAYQDPGIACGPAPTTAPTSVPAIVTSLPSTSVANTSVTNTSTTITSTTAVVRGTSIVPSTIAAVAVLDTNTGNGPSRSAPASLAITGVPSKALGGTGLVLLVVGLGLIATSRRQTVPAAHMVSSRWSVDPTSPFGLD